jgi:DNA-binding SARP family transcriptional activator
MSLAQIVANITHAFDAHSANARLVLLHAKSRYRAALLSRLLADDDRVVFYYALGSEDTDVRSFLNGFIHEIAEQVPSFGAQVNHVGFDNLPNLDSLLEALAADLDTLTTEPFLVFLDEFDRADISDDLQSLLERLIDYMPARCKLVISGRNLPRFAWLALISRQKAVMLRDDDLIINDFYETQAYEDAMLHANALGPGTVLTNEDEIGGWEGHLPRLLFFFALERPFVTRSEICQAFWPDLQSEQAVNVFHVTKRRLHKALEVLGLDVLVHDGGYYRVNPVLRVHYDMVDFVALLMQGRLAETAQAKLQAYQRVIEMYQRPFLQGHNELWITRRRQDYQAGYIEALCGVAEVRLNEDRPEHALTLLQRAAQENPLRQDLHRRIMNLYADLGRRSETASHYNTMRDLLNKHDIDLEPETEQLFNQLMSS